ncbi:MAG: hypothetical protein ACRDJN_09985, partial [Chloroflexota bacterium]
TGTHTNGQGQKATFTVARVGLGPVRGLAVVRPLKLAPAHLGTMSAVQVVSGVPLDRRGVVVAGDGPRFAVLAGDGPLAHVAAGDGPLATVLAGEGP